MKADTGEGETLTVESVAHVLGWKTVVMPQPEAEVRGGYAGDLLSFVMVHAPRGAAWMTIMNHVNVIAVAVYAGVSCVVVCEGEPVGEKMVLAAREHGVNLFCTEDTVFRVSERLARLAEADADGKNQR